MEINAGSKASADKLPTYGGSFVPGIIVPEIQPLLIGDSFQSRNQRQAGEAGSYWIIGLIFDCEAALRNQDRELRIGARHERQLPASDLSSADGRFEAWPSTRSSGRSIDLRHTVRFYLIFDDLLPILPMSKILISSLRLST